MSKRGQMKLSFGMIFSIFLIIIFIAFAFYSIKTFIGIQDAALSGKFSSDFQKDIDTIWKSAESSQEFEYSIPLKIKQVCIVNFETSKKGYYSNLYDDMRSLNFGEGNFVLYTENSDSEYFEIENINLEQTTSSENPFCFENSNGKIKLILEKEISESLVLVKKVG